MNWLEPFNRDFFIDEEEDSSPFFRSKSIDGNGVPKQYSLLTQFFLLLSAQLSDSVTYYPIKNGLIKDKELREIILHFDERKEFIVNDKPIEIMLAKPNNDSLKHLMSNPLNPVIKSLFPQSKQLQQVQFSPSSPYRVIPEKINSYEDKEFDLVLAYLKENTESPSFGFQLSNWILNDSLKNSHALRYFSHHTQTLCLWIDESKRIISIEMQF
ncbi:hypothetical protein F7984_16850 [Pradoshia sp. D12]|uniref:hypothetical protein n=1 Tax=Bacillaceae TaxID=186817 RepID=UPI00080AF945|nr:MULTISPECIES: hypothetical protein [Bacillaceae]OCA84761.1 hypothetical protein A8L44_10275 [Bacillus sp. FJAT-27986]QFK72773.1 hypothetical protein F7984_16850 [Pradoshia sp. D12]TPF71767.1 hypothetical protein FHY44_09545 [Bacillus sp. D12]